MKYDSYFERSVALISIVICHGYWRFKAEDGKIRSFIKYIMSLSCLGHWETC